MRIPKLRRSTAVLLVAGVTALALSTVAVAAAGHGGPHAKGPMAERVLEHRFERLAEYLELTEAQRAEAEALRERWLGDLRERHEANAASFETIHEMAAADNPDPTAIGELVIQMHREREAMRAAHESYHAELVKVLTPEQAEKLEAWEAARPWGKGFGPPRHRRDHHASPSPEPDNG